MEKLVHASAEEFDKLFRKVTIEGAKESLAAGLSIVGTDEQGTLVIGPNPDGTITPFIPK